MLKSSVLLLSGNELQLCFKYVSNLLRTRKEAIGTFKEYSNSRSIDIDIDLLIVFFKFNVSRSIFDVWYYCYFLLPYQLKHYCNGYLERSLTALSNQMNVGIMKTDAISLNCIKTLMLSIFYCQNTGFGSKPVLHIGCVICKVISFLIYAVQFRCFTFPKT